MGNFLDSFISLVDRITGGSKVKAAIAALLSVTFVFSSMQLIMALAGYHAAAAEYGRVAVEAHGDITDNKKLNEILRDSKTVSMDKTISVSMDEAASVSLNGAVSANAIINFSELADTNSDIVGWMIIPGTVVDYPIVKSHDNQEYLGLSFEKNKSKNGTVFMDAANHSDWNDFNTVIYGHNMKDGSMFKTIAKYRDQSFYKEHPTVTIAKAGGRVSTYNIISGYTTNTRDIVYTKSFDSIADYTLFVNAVKKKSAYNTGIAADVYKRSVVLSTCVGVGGNQRFVLVLQEQ